VFRELSVPLIAIAVSLSWLALAAVVLAQDPTPLVTPVPSPILIDPLDPRTGEQANMVGAPLLALLVVVGGGAIAALGTYVYVLFARRRGGRRSDAR
jgi:hypothetical protein